MLPEAPFCRPGGRSMESAPEGTSGVTTSREEAKWGGFSEVATSFSPRRAFRVSRPPREGAEWGGFSEVATGFRPRRAFRVSRPAA